MFNWKRTQYGKKWHIVPVMLTAVCGEEAACDRHSGRFPPGQACKICLKMVKADLKYELKTTQKMLDTLNQLEEAGDGRKVRTL